MSIRPYIPESTVKFEILFYEKQLNYKTQFAYTSADKESLFKY